MTYSEIERVYILSTGRKVALVEVSLQSPPPSGAPVWWRLSRWPATTPLTPEEGAEMAAYLIEALQGWTDPFMEADEPLILTVDGTKGVISH